MNQLTGAFHTSRLHSKHNQIEPVGKKKEVKKRAGKGNMEHSYLNRHGSPNPHLHLHTPIFLHIQPCLHTTVVYGTHNHPTSEPTKSIHQLPHRRPMSDTCRQEPRLIACPFTALVPVYPTKISNSVLCFSVGTSSYRTLYRQPVNGTKTAPAYIHTLHIMAPTRTCVLTRRFSSTYHIVAPALTSATSSHILAPTLTSVYTRQVSSTYNHVYTPR